MKGLTREQFKEIQEFVQKHHKFGYVREEDRVTKWPYAIKYIDGVYDSRDETIWSISFRPPGVRFATNDFNAISPPPKGWKYDNLYDLVMDYLNDRFDPNKYLDRSGKCMFLIQDNHYDWNKVKVEIPDELQKHIFELAQKRADQCKSFIITMDKTLNKDSHEDDEFVDKNALETPIFSAIVDGFHLGLKLRDNIILPDDNQCICEVDASCCPVHVDTEKFDNDSYCSNKAVKNGLHSNCAIFEKEKSCHGCNYLKNIKVPKDDA